MEHRAFPVPDGLHGSRADSALATAFGFSRSTAAAILAAGGASLDGVTLRKSDRLTAGAWLEVSWQEQRGPEIVPISLPELRVLAEDDDLIVVDKPPGVAAHPSLGWSGPTVLGALAGVGYRIATSGPPERAGIVHRLDAGTSGLMVVAKSEHAYRELKHAFKAREVEKTYYAVVQGHPDPLAGTIEGAIGRHPGSEWKFAVTREGKPSVTHYTTLEAFPYASLLEIELETGRTHQIRVHMSAQRHPCVGDTMYGADPVLSERLGLSRQWLHAMRLGFRHPATGAPVVYESSVPSDLQHALDVLENPHIAARTAEGNDDERGGVRG